MVNIKVILKLSKKGDWLNLDSVEVTGQDVDEVKRTVTSMQDVGEKK